MLWERGSVISIELKEKLIPRSERRGGGHLRVKHKKLRPEDGWRKSV